MKQFSWIPLLFFVIFSDAVLAQEKTYSSQEETPYNVYVSGTSTLHDWEAKVATVKDFPKEMKVDLSVGSMINSFGFKVEVASMDGGRGSTMNNKIYKALQSETHPDIIFEQKEPATIQAGEEGRFKLLSKGMLSMAGVEKMVEIEVSISIKDGVLTFSGAKPLKMSDFAIEPPSAMFGQIKTADDVTVHFVFNYVAS